jgi:hypothetical protein
MTNKGTPSLWPLLTGGRCLDVGMCYEDSNWDSKINNGRWSQVVAIRFGLTVIVGLGLIL